TAVQAKTGRRIGIGWMVVSLIGAVLTGLVGIAYFQLADQELANPETVFLELTQILVHPFIAGLVLAAVLAAIMSTVSSQLIVCSSALIEDLYKIVMKRSLSSRQLVMLGRLGVLAVAVIAAVLALDPQDT